MDECVDSLPEARRLVELVPATAFASDEDIKNLWARIAVKIAWRKHTETQFNKPHDLDDPPPPVEYPQEDSLILALQFVASCAEAHFDMLTSSTRLLFLDIIEGCCGNRIDSGSKIYQQGLAALTALTRGGSILLFSWIGASKYSDGTHDKKSEPSQPLLSLLSLTTEALLSAEPGTDITPSAAAALLKLSLAALNQANILTAILQLLSADLMRMSQLEDVLAAIALITASSESLRPNAVLLARQVFTSHQARSSILLVCNWAETDLERREDLGHLHLGLIATGSAHILCQAAWGPQALPKFPLEQSLLIVETVEYRVPVLVEVLVGTLTLLTYQDWEAIISFTADLLSFWPMRQLTGLQWSTPESVAALHRMLILSIHSSLSLIPSSSSVDTFFDLPEPLAVSLLEHEAARISFDVNEHRIDCLVNSFVLNKMTADLVITATEVCEGQRLDFLILDTAQKPFLLSKLVNAGAQIFGVASPVYCVRLLDSYNNIAVTAVDPGVSYILFKISAMELRGIHSINIACSHDVPTKARLLGLKFALSTRARSDFHIFFENQSSDSEMPYIGMNPLRCYAGSSKVLNSAILDMDSYLAHLVEAVSNETDWDIYSLVFQNLSYQLQNIALFAGAPKAIGSLRTFLCFLITRETAASSIVHLPKAAKKSDIYLLAFKLLAVLISYKSFFNKQDLDEIISTVELGLQKWPSTSRFCLQTLTNALLELPGNMIRLITNVLLKVSRLTSSSMSPYVLEFLSTLSRLPELYVNCSDADFRRVFGIALQSIQSSTATSHSTALSQYVVHLAYYVITVWFVNLKIAERRKFIPFITKYMIPTSGGTTVTVDENVELVWDVLIQNAYVDCSPRPSADLINPLQTPTARTDGIAPEKTWIIGNAVVTIRNSGAPGWIEVQIRRPSGFVSFSSRLGNSSRAASNQVSILAAFDGNPQMRNTSENDLTRRTRSASQSFGPGIGTYSDVPDSLRPRSVSVSSSSVGLDTTEGRETTESRVVIDPSFLLLQLSPLSATTPNEVPLLLGTDEATVRALKVLDRTPVVDLHKVGVVFVGPGQSDEVEILANTHGSWTYTQFLHSLGEVVELSRTTMYTGGLDKSPDGIDGKHCVVWEDNASGAQMVFHAATMMPTNLDKDPRCSFKKRHIGNDFVVIAFDESGLSAANNGDRAFGLHTLPGQFNFVNIIISRLADGETETLTDSDAQEPESLPPQLGFRRASNQYESSWFRVRMAVRDEVGLGYTGVFGDDMGRIVSGRNLGATVRQAALHANMLSLVAAQSQAGGGMFISNARERLRQIKRLHDRVSKLDPRDPKPDSVLDFTTFT
ncbi:hypothetical protein DFJ73DRAFT_817870 [Zopfochytrium polystomum]|nr:hypothetical protein DFJ73DRAFT_817870 [Zopfochytrium polystomum]